MRWAWNWFSTCRKQSEEKPSGRLHAQHERTNGVYRRPMRACRPKRSSRVAKKSRSRAIDRHARPDRRALAATIYRLSGAASRAFSVGDSRNHNHRYRRSIIKRPVSVVDVQRQQISLRHRRCRADLRSMATARPLKSIRFGNKPTTPPLKDSRRVRNKPSIPVLETEIQDCVRARASIVFPDEQRCGAGAWPVNGAFVDGKIAV